MVGTVQHSTSIVMERGVMKLLWCLLTTGVMFLEATSCAEPRRQVPDTGQPYGMGAEMGVGSPSTPGSSQTSFGSGPAAGLGGAPGTGPSPGRQ